MSTAAIAIRGAVFARLSAGSVDVGEFTKSRMVSVPTASIDDCPILSVFILRETMTPDGESNVGAYDFINDVLIGVSIVRALSTPDVLDTLMDKDVSFIKALLTDATFTKRAPGALFESIEGFNIARTYPKEGETYFSELRAEITFRTREEFAPTITNNFEGVNVTARPLQSPNAPPIRVRWDVPTEDDEP